MNYGFSLYQVFESMLSLGWLIKSTIDCSRKDNDKNSLFFERCHPVQTTVPVVSDYRLISPCALIYELSLDQYPDQPFETYEVMGQVDEKAYT